MPGAAVRARELVGREREFASLERLLGAVRGGGNATLFVHGEPGVGKTALVERLLAGAPDLRLLRAAGVEGEVDLPYAGLQQLCRPLADTIGVLPGPQRDALRAAFGLGPGEATNRYVVGLAVLSLMSEAAAAQPLLCVVDDAQWLDAETTQALAFVGRRLGADSIGLVIAGREFIEELGGLPAMHLGGLGMPHARALLDAVLVGRLDGPVRERFLAETHGNPLALIELPRTLTPAEAATGAVRSPGDSLSTRIEGSFRRRLESLPEDARRLLVLAAAEPLGDPLLLRRAAAQLGLGVEAVDAAEEAGLLEIRERASFPHPLARSAVYKSAAPRERREAHSALAAATDPELDPDRRAWHRAHGTVGPDEDVASELERTAARAKSRGGLAAAGAFLERAATLTPDAGRRAQRTLAAAAVMYEAGGHDAVDNLLRTIDTSQLDRLSAARVERLRAAVSIATEGLGKERVLRSLAATERLARLDPELGRAALLEDVGGFLQFVADRETVAAVGEAFEESAASGDPAELAVRGWARLVRHGFPAGTDLLRQAVVALREKPHPEESDLALLVFSSGIASALWDLEGWKVLAGRAVQVARDSGALRRLPLALADWSEANVSSGDFQVAAAALAEARAVQEATNASPSGTSTVSLDAWRLPDSQALERIVLIESDNTATPHDCDRARALAYNGAGRYQAAFQAAERAAERHPSGSSGWALVELVEAAVHFGQSERASGALEQLAERTQLAGTDWGLGLEARSRALVSQDLTVAEGSYREAIDRLRRAGARPDLGRAHLLYGEWLRRESRRIDAREQLRTAIDLFDEIGIPGFGDRARRELIATGEKARRRTVETRDDLTAHERQIAELARDGLSNPEIGARLFLSPRTVEWHLRKVYGKLGIRSRYELAGSASELVQT